MKIKISVTLAEELVLEMDKLSDRYGNRSALVEQAIRSFLAIERQRARDVQDLEILNRRAANLNQEAQEVLDYQLRGPLHPGAGRSRRGPGARQQYPLR